MKVEVCNPYMSFGFFINQEKVNDFIEFMKLSLDWGVNFKSKISQIDRSSGTKIIGPKGDFLEVSISYESKETYADLVDHPEPVKSLIIFPNCDELRIEGHIYNDDAMEHYNKNSVSRQMEQLRDKLTDQVDIHYRNAKKAIGFI